MYGIMERNCEVFYSEEGEPNVKVDMRFTFKEAEAYVYIMGLQYPERMYWFHEKEILQ